MQHNREHSNSNAEQHGAWARNRPKTRVLRLWSFLVWLAKDQWFLIVMGILIAISSQAQVPLAQQEKKTNIINYVAVSLIFFLNGCAIPTNVFIQNLARWRIHILTQVQSFLMVSALAFGLMSAAASNPEFLNADLLIGIIIVGCLPTA